jgi:hypothetical protein
MGIGNLHIQSLYLMRDEKVVYYESRKKRTMSPKILFYIFIYYESTKRKLKTKYICWCRCYERLQPKTKEGCSWVGKEKTKYFFFFFR